MISKELKIRKQYTNICKAGKVLLKEEVVFQYQEKTAGIRVQDGIFTEITYKLISNNQLNDATEIRLTSFDMDVLDSIYTLRKNGFNTVTISDIARTLSGNLKLKATHKLLNIIRNSILKMTPGCFCCRLHHINCILHLKR